MSMSGNDELRISSPTLQPDPDAPQNPLISSPVAEESEEVTERFSAWLLRGPLTVVLGCLGLVQLASWTPHYLTWPSWADHDVFATIAQGWRNGLLPYRDLPCNNFPGTIYLFWGLGMLFGWGKMLPFYAVDAGMLVLLGCMMLLWSQRRLGGVLPGLIGYLTFISYYLGLDYAHAGQRDWQGPFFAVFGLLFLQAWPGRTGRVVSAIAMAIAVCFRPQTVLLMPALALSIDASLDGENASSLGKRFRTQVLWGGLFTLTLALTFIPLVWAGVMRDFLNGIRLTSYGGHYNRVTISSLAMGLFVLLAPFKMLLVPIIMALIAAKMDRPTRKLVLSWIFAFGFVSLYKPLSPMPHTYLNIPLILIWSITLSVLLRLVLEVARPLPSVQLVACLVVLALGVTIRPEFCMAGPTLRALASFAKGEIPEAPAPPGYRPGTVPTSGFYPWEDYRDLITYLRNHTSPETRVANVLKGDPAVTSPATRASVFPTESLAWLRMVRPEQESDFADRLAKTPESVVVWVPGEVGPDPKFTLEQITPVIRDLYEPEAQFGKIEVWRRRAHPETSSLSRRPTSPRHEPSRTK